MSRFATALAASLGLPLLLTALLAGMGLTLRAAYQAGDGSAAGQAGPALEELAQRNQELERHRLGVLRAGKARLAVMAEVLAARMSLADAADAFQRISRANPRFEWSRFRESYRGRTDRERQALSVIQWARENLHDQPARAAEVVGRLERELQDLCRSAESSGPSLDRDGGGDLTAQAVNGVVQKAPDR